MTKLVLLLGQYNALQLAESRAMETQLEKLGRDTVLMSHSVAGSSLAPTDNGKDWHAVDDDDPETGELYEDLISEVTTFLIENPDAELGSIVWFQGERDALFGEFSSSYEENLRTLISQLGEDFGVSVPFTIVQLADQMPRSADQSVNWQTVQEAQKQIADEFSNVYLVEPDVVAAEANIAFDTLVLDDAHYNDAGLELLAEAIVTQPTFLGLEIEGTEGDDLLQGSDGGDNLHGLAGDDLILGGQGDDAIYGGDGDDILQGQSGDDQIFGESGNDQIRGGEGNDLIRGGYGDDFLNGRAGDDHIVGRKDDDTMLGGSGNDTFELNTGDGNDIILDFDVNEDVLLINGRTDLSNVTVISENEGDVILGYGSDDRITLSDVSLEDLWPTQETWSFLSSPDLFNGSFGDFSGGADPEIAALFGEDYADIAIGAPGWTPGSVNGMTVELASVWLENARAMVETAGGSPEAILIAGDMLYGDTENLYDVNTSQNRLERRETFEELFHDGTPIDVSTAEGQEEFYAALTRSFETYGSWANALWSEVGVEDVIVAIGDHEIGNNPWTLNEEQTFSVPAQKEAFNDAYLSHLDIAETYQGVSTRPPDGEIGNYDEASYAYQKNNVLFLNVDTFMYQGNVVLGVHNNRQSSIINDVRGAHLEWVKDILAAADADNSVDHVIIQAHTAAIGPNNAINSGELTIEGGEHSAFWQALSEHGTNEGGKVRLYIAGEVHATTTTEDDTSGIVQIVHGAHNDMGTAYNRLNPTWIAFEVNEDKISGVEYTIENERTQGTFNWQPARGENAVADTVTSGAIEIGTFELDLSSGQAEVTVTGNLEAPVLQNGDPNGDGQGYITFVGGDDDDMHWADHPTILSFRSNNELYGRGGNDTLHGQRGDDYLDGGSGSDSLFGGRHEDLIIGGSGNDILSGGTDNDVFRFGIGDGSDTITDFAEGTNIIQIEGGATNIAQSGADVVVTYLGGSIHVLDANSADVNNAIDATLTASLVDNLYAYQDPQTHADMVRNFEVGATPFSDSAMTLTDVPVGLSNARLIETRHDHRNVIDIGVQMSFDAIKDSELYVGLDASANSIPVWLEDWTLTSHSLTTSDGAVYDVFTRDLSEGERVEIFGANAKEFGGINNVIVMVQDDDSSVTGTEENDVITGTTADDVIQGFGGDDIIDGGEGDDNIRAGAGDDHVIGGAGNDVIDGRDGNDFLQGFAGNDIIDGNNGNDVIRAGFGNDIVSGGSGDDTINGRAGDDIMTGGSGADVFIFDGTGGNDVITDFELNLDHLDINSDGFAVSLRTSGDGSVIEYGPGYQILLEGVQLTQADLEAFF